MTTYIRAKAALTTLFLFGTMAATVQAEQWNGPHTPTGSIWRPGSVALGFDPSGSSSTPLSSKYNAPSQAPESSY